MIVLTEAEKGTGKVDEFDVEGMGGGKMAERVVTEWPLRGMYRMMLRAAK